MSSNILFLKDNNQIVNLDGMELTVGELKEAVIGNAYYQNKLSEIRRQIR